MKKYLLSFLCILLLVLCVSSCTGNTVDTTYENSDTSADEPNENMLTDAEKRDIKVSFNVDAERGAFAKRIVAVMGENEAGNKRIEYAPNAFQYYVFISYQKEGRTVVSNVKNVIDKCTKDVIDVIKNDEKNTVVVLFPDFDSFYSCQEDLLDCLSKNDSVLDVEVGYFDIQNGTKKLIEAYEYICIDNEDTYNNVLKRENVYLKSYGDFVSLFGAEIENDIGLQKITEQDFNENYVFVILNTHYGEFDICDAKLVGDTVFFTTNYYTVRRLVNGNLNYNVSVTLVPKSELGELPENAKVTAIEAVVWTAE